MPFQIKPPTPVGPRVSDRDFEDRIHDQKLFGIGAGIDTPDGDGLFVDWTPLACPNCGAPQCHCYYSSDAVAEDLYERVRNVEQNPPTTRRQSKSMRRIVRAIIARLVQTRIDTSAMNCRRMVIDTQVVLPLESETASAPKEQTV